MSGFIGQVALPNWTQTNLLFNPDAMRIRRNEAEASDFAPAAAENQLLTHQEALKASQLANQFTAAIQPNKIDLMQSLSGPGAPPPPAAAIIQVPLASSGGPGNIENALIGAESTGRTSVVNRQGYAGLGQFGSPRLETLQVYTPPPGEVVPGKKWEGQMNGEFHIPGFPEVKTKADYLANSEAQRAVMHLQVADLKGRIAGIPGADKFDETGLIGVGHLGGPDGIRKFVESGGRYNAQDANGTTLMNYYNKFSGNPAGLRAAAGHPDGPLDPNHPALAHPAYQVASNGSVAPPSGGQGVQPMQMDEPARASVRELLQAQKLAIASGDMKAYAQLEARKEAIAGPGGVIAPDGNVYVAPGSEAARSRASGAVEQGKVAPLMQLAGNKADLERQTHYANSQVDVTAAGIKGRQATAEKMNEPHFAAAGTKMVIPNQLAAIPQPQGALQDGGASAQGGASPEQRGVITIGKDETPPAILKMEEGDIPEIKNASNIIADLGRFSDMITDKKLVLSPTDNFFSKARNATGNSSEVSKNYSSFQSTIRGIVNESLRLNKGTQTEGDAQRSADALLSNLSDEGIVSQRLKELQAYNKRVVQFKVDEIQRRRADNGLAPMDTSKFTSSNPAVGLGSTSSTNFSASNPAKPMSQADFKSLPSGAHFINPADGKLLTKN